MIGKASAEGRSCSRAGCSSPATFTVNWRNPKIHSADRVKVWLACGAHVDYLRDYLAARDFPVTVGTADATLSDAVSEPR